MVQEFIKRLLHGRSFCISSLSSPSSFATWVPFEQLRKLSQKGWRFTLSLLHVNSRVGIWFQVYEPKALRPWEWGGQPLSTNFTSRSPGGCCILREIKALGCEVTISTCTLPLVHRAVWSQCFAEEANHLINKPWENPSIYLLATLTPTNTPEHTILLFSHSNSSIGGIGWALAP